MSEGQDDIFQLPGNRELRGLRILLVDDDPAVVRRFREGLGPDYAYLEAADGQEALTLLRDERPDLVISDVEMPRMGGLEFCRIAKRHFPLVPVILTTARAGSKLEGLDLGADDYLVKPVDPLELGVRVRNMLRLKVLQDQLRLANERLREINDELYRLSIYDPLTGLHNRFYFNRHFDVEFKRAVRYKTRVTCLMMDLDHFKLVNDAHGHQAGDEVLRHVAQVVRSTLRGVDLVARYGGEELVALLPSTPLPQGLVAAERVRQAVEDLEVVHEGRPIRCTVSIGCAEHPGPEVHTADDLLRLADRALYRAKDRGRNRVAAADG